VKIFVSYSNIDGPDIADGISKLFSKPQYDVFISNINIRPGNLWEKEIQDNLENCDIFIIIVTRGVLNSKYVEEKEIPKAIELKKRIIPCRYYSIPITQLKWGLEQIQNIEFNDTPDLLRKLDAEVTKEVNLLAETFEEIDKEVLKIKLYKTGGTTSNFIPSIIAIHEYNKIIFKDAQSGTVIPSLTITPDKFKTLDTQSRDVLRTYQRTMLKAFKDWKKWNKSNIMNYQNQQAEIELRQIVHIMCDNWTKLIRQLNRLGIALDDHYSGIYGICDDYGYVERQENI
jgi:hypothetical protein